MSTLNDFEQAVRTVKLIPDANKKLKQQTLEALIESMAGKVPPQLQPLWNILFVESEERASARMFALGNFAKTSWMLTDKEAANAVQQFGQRQ